VNLPEFDDFPKSGPQVKKGQPYEFSCLTNRVSGLFAPNSKCLTRQLVDVGRAQDSRLAPSVHITS
jgi:hypothetical protein